MIDELYEKQARAGDLEERKKFVRACEKRLLDEEAHVLWTLQWHRIIPHNAKVKGFTKRGIAKLVGLRWDGNVRELENVVERAVVLSTGVLIDEADIPSGEVQNAEDFFARGTGDFPTITQLEERYMKLVLEKTGGRKDKAAQILGINRRTLYRKEREFGLIPTDSPEEEDMREAAALEEDDHS